MTLPLAVFAAASIAGGTFAQQDVAAQGEGGRPFTVAMTGDAERPGPGDADGTGSIEFRVNAGQNRVCYSLTVSNIDGATAAHTCRVILPLRRALP